MTCPKCASGIVSKMRAAEISNVARIWGRLMIAAAVLLLFQALRSVQAFRADAVGSLVAWSLVVVELGAGVGFALKAWDLLGAKKIIGCRVCRRRFEQGPYGSRR